MAEILWRYHQPRSVIDLGCGLGFFLNACAKRGAEITGVDGDWVDPGDSVIPGPARRNADLNAPYEARRYDLAATIEVAEHLKPARSESFVDDLCALSDVVLFSAGIPDQAGGPHQPALPGRLGRDVRGPRLCLLRPDPPEAGRVRPSAAMAGAERAFVRQGGGEIDPLLAEHRIVPKAASYATKWHYRRQMRKLRKQIRNMKAPK